MGTDGRLIRCNEDAIRIEVNLWETGLSELPSLGVSLCHRSQEKMPPEKVPTNQHRCNQRNDRRRHSSSRVPSNRNRGSRFKAG